MTTRFITETRTSTETRHVVKIAPQQESVLPSVRAAHDAIDPTGMLPNDFIYAACAAADDVGQDNPDVFDLGDLGDLAADMVFQQYETNDRDVFQWAADHGCVFAGFIADAVDGKLSPVETLRDAIYLAARTIAEAYLGAEFERCRGNVTPESACQQEADQLAEAIGCELEVNREFVDRYCTDDVREILDDVDDADLAEVLTGALGDAREWGYYTCDHAVVLPVGEIEIQRPDGLAWREFLADPSDWTIDGDFAYCTMNSVRVDVDLAKLREAVAE